MEHLWHIEQQLWLAGVTAYEEHMAANCIMVFGPMGMLHRPRIIESLRQAPRWAEVEMTDRITAESGSTAILAYRAKAHRENAEPCTALCSSTYVDEHGSWKIMQHQQTPL